MALSALNNNVTQRPNPKQAFIVPKFKRNLACGFRSKDVNLTSSCTQNSSLSKTTPQNPKAENQKPGTKTSDEGEAEVWPH